MFLLASAALSRHLYPVHGSQLFSGLSAVVDDKVFVGWLQSYSSLSPWRLAQDHSQQGFIELDTSCWGMES